MSRILLALGLLGLMCGSTFAMGERVSAQALAEEVSEANNFRTNSQK